MYSQHASKQHYQPMTHHFMMVKSQINLKNPGGFLKECQSMASTFLCQKHYADSQPSHSYSGQDNTCQ